MKSSKYLIAGGTINWTESLAKYYAEDERKRREHGERLAQRDAQQLEANRRASPIGALRDLAQLSSTVSKLVQQQKVNEEKEKQKRLYENEIEWLTAEKDEAGAKLRKEFGYKWSADVNDIKQQKIELNKRMNLPGNKERFEAYPELRDLILKSSAASIIEQQEWRGHELSKTSHIVWNDAINNDPDTQVEFEKIKNNPIEVRQHYKRFVNDLLLDQGFTKEFIAANYSQQINRIADSKSVMAKLDYNRVSLATKELESAATLKASLEKGADQVAFTAQSLILNGVDTSRGITHADSQQNFTNMLSRLIAAGEISPDIRDLIKIGEVKHEAGSIIKVDTVTDETTGAEKSVSNKYAKGSILLKPEQWQQIQGAYNKYATNLTAAKDAEWEQRGTNLVARMYSGDLTQAEKDKFELDAEIAGQSNKQWFKDFKTMGLAEQSPETYESLRTTWEVNKATGFFNQSEASINAIPHAGLRKEMLTAFNVQKNAEGQIGYKQFQFNSTIHNARSSVPWAEGSTKLSTVENQISLDVEAVRKQVASKLIAANIQANNGVFRPDAAILIQADRAAQDYWDANDGGVIGGTGKFAIDKKDGEYVNWNKYQEYIIPVSYDHDVKFSDITAPKFYSNLERQKINYRKSDGTLDLQGLINSGVYNKNQIASTLSTLRYSEEMAFIAEQLQVPIHELFQASVNAFINSPEGSPGRNFAELLNLENTTSNDGPILERLKQKGAELTGIKGIHFRNAIRYIEIHGWNGTNNSMKLRIYKGLLENSPELEGTDKQLENIQEYYGPADGPLM